MTGALAAIVALGLGGLGFAGAAVAFALRIAGLREALANARRDAADALRVRDSAIGELELERQTRADVERRYRAQVEQLLGELASCGDDRARGAVALDGLRKLLSRGAAADTR